MDTGAAPTHSMLGEDSWRWWATCLTSASYENSARRCIFPLGSKRTQRLQPRRPISRTLPLYRRLNSITWRCDAIRIHRSGQLMQYADWRKMYAVFHSSLVFYDRRGSGDAMTRQRYCYQNIFHWTVYGPSAHSAADMQGTELTIGTYAPCIQIHYLSSNV